MPEKVLVIGASPNEWRYSFIATKMLRNYGHEVYCFGRRPGSCAGLPIQTEFPSNTNYDTITLYINPGLQKQYYEQMIALQPKRVIFNPGTENPELEEMLEQKGIVADEACTLVLLRTGQY